MSLINILRYSPKQHADAWDTFVDQSCNGTFLFRRAFMDYHADRFQDHSLLFCDGGKTVAVFPANITSGVLTSHAGLSYGGLIVSASTTTLTQLECLRLLVDYCRQSQVRKLVIKPIPYIYASQPADAISYAFFRLGFRHIACGLSTAINLRSPLPFRTLRMRGVRRAARLGLRIVEGNEHIEAFHAILNTALVERHNVRPVHTPAEMLLLASRFPSLIRLFTVWNGDELAGGVWMFYTAKVAHAQYIVATEKGMKEGALDFLFSHLISNAPQDYFDFGVCTEDNGNFLNEGLLFQKEGFGARAVIYDQWSLDITAD